MHSRNMTVAKTRWYRCKKARACSHGVGGCADARSGARSSSLGSAGRLYAATGGAIIFAASGLRLTSSRPRPLQRLALKYAPPHLVHLFSVDHVTASAELDWLAVVGCGRVVTFMSVG